MCDTNIAALPAILIQVRKTEQGVHKANCLFCRVTFPVSPAGSNGRCNTHRIGSFQNEFAAGPTCRGYLN
jgi:hypothetical protein